MGGGGRYEKLNFYFKQINLIKIEFFKIDYLELKFRVLLISNLKFCDDFLYF